VTRLRGGEAVSHQTVSDPFAPAHAASGLWQGWVRFWFEPVDPTGLHGIRLLTGLLLLSWLLSFAGQENALFGLRGWFDTQAYKEASRMRAPEAPPAAITWSLVYLCGENEGCVTGLYWASVLVLVLFTLGVATRLTAPLAWVVVGSFTANPAIAYDADALLLLPAFYALVGYSLLGLWHGNLQGSEKLLGSFGCLLLGRAEQSPSIAARLALRLFQVHFALAVVVSGLHKLQSGDWWSGTALWYPLVPPFQKTLAEVRQWAERRDFYLVLLSLATYAVLVWQLAFPFFAWRRRWRPVLLGGAVVGWLGSAFLYQLPLFGPAYLLGALSYLTPQEWAWVRQALGRLPGVQRVLGTTGTASPREDVRRPVGSSVKGSKP